jgi:hypothetical protein
MPLTQYPERSKTHHYPFQIMIKEFLHFMQKLSSQNAIFYTIGKK